MKTNIIIVIALFIVVLVGGWYFFFKDESKKLPDQAETTTVRVAYLPVVHGLPLYTAVEKGYFQEAGLKIEVVPFEAPNQIIDALMNGTVDFGSAVALGIAGVADTKNPGKIKVYGVNGEMGNNSSENILIPINSPVQSISELKGKKFGILAGTIQWKTIAREILAQNSLDMDKDVTIVELAPSVQVQALASGQVDALLALEPIPTVALSQSAGKILSTAPAKQFIADPFWYGADVVRTEFAEQKPETTAKVISIMERSVVEVNDNFDQHRRYLKNYTALSEILALKVPPIDYKTCPSLTGQDKESIKKFYALFAKYNVVEREISLENLLYCR